MRYKEPFKVFKKRLQSGNYLYYYTTYDRFNKRHQYSTGYKTKHLALKYCYDLFDKKSLIPKPNILFSTFTKDWFIYDKCPYIQARINRGHQYSKAVAHQKRLYLDRKIIPLIGNIPMNEITSAHIEELILELKPRWEKL